MFQPGMLERPRAAARRPQRRRAAELPEGHLRPARRPDHDHQRLQEADHRGQPAASSSAVALEDAKAFQNTLNKIIALAGRAQEARVPGDDDLRLRRPRHAQRRPAANVNQFKGPISLAIAKDTLFVSTEPTLLEQVLRGGGPALADSPAFQAVAKEIPEKVSSLTFVRPEEQARLSYDMIKSGQFEKALQAAAIAGGPDVSQGRQAHRQGQAARLLRLRQVPLPGRRLRRHGRGRRDLDRLHPPEGQPLIERGPIGPTSDLADGGGRCIEHARRRRLLHRSGSSRQNRHSRSSLTRDGLGSPDVRVRPIGIGR